MQVPLLDLKAQLAPIREEVIQAVTEVIDSTRYIGGPVIERLETQIAEYVGTAHAVGVTSGTDALLISLMALDVGPGDLVITTPYSFFATVGVVARLRAQPIFVDINPETYNINPNSLRKWFEKAGDKRKQVKAIIPVHLYGQCADMDPIMEIAREFDVAVVEDAAQAIGASYPSKTAVKKAGSIGDLGCFSFFPSKNLGAMGDGGIVATNDDALAAKLRVMRNHGAKPKYFHSMVGGNFRLDPIQAAVLLVKLSHLETWHQQRRENARYYDESLQLEDVDRPQLKWGREHHIYNQYVISVRDRRDELRTFLKENQIGNEVYYPLPFHEQECFQNLGYAKGDFPHSEHAARHTLALPIYPELTHEMQDYVAAKIGEFYG